MPLSSDQLRQLLTERSDPARNRPAPAEPLAARIRHARIRRAAGASLMAIVVLAGLVGIVHVVRTPAAGPATAGRNFPLPSPHPTVPPIGG
jgi:hypothetical protein